MDSTAMPIAEDKSKVLWLMDENVPSLRSDQILRELKYDFVVAPMADHTFTPPTVRYNMGRDGRKDTEICPLCNPTESIGSTKWNERGVKSEK
jgi:hypothetical protein